MLHVDHFDLGQSFDWHFTEGAIRGWGLPPEGLGPLKVTVKVGDAVLAEGVTGVHRPDLDGVVDNAHVGFDIPIDFDLHILIREGIGQLRIEATTEAGVVVDTEMAPIALAVVTMWQVAHERKLPHCYGRGFVLDNRDEFAVGLPVIASGEPRAILPMVFVKLGAFGDFIWWSEEQPGVPDCLRPLQRIGPRAAQEAAAGRLLIVLDMSNEGQAFEATRQWMDSFHAALASRGIPLRSCAFITQNRPYGDDYRNAYPDGMTILNYDYYIRRFAGLQGRVNNPETISSHVAQHLGDLGRVRERAYLCMNFTPRAHRIATLSYLFGIGAVDSGYVSFAGFDTVKLKVNQTELPAGWTDNETLRVGLDRLRERGRMALDLPPVGDVAVPEFVVGDRHFYDESYFSLVTESEVAEPALQRITEKVMKPMSMFHPVLIVGNCGSLPLLRDFGFRTFSPWIDESYDTIEDPERRFYAVMAEFERLLGMDPDKMAEWYAQMSDVLVHNFFTANTLLDRWYRHVAEPNLFRALSSIPVREYCDNTASIAAPVPGLTLT